MADDYLTDDEQWEAIKSWISENGTWTLTVVLLAAAGVLGYRYYTAFHNHRDLSAAAQFQRLTFAIDQNDSGAAHQIADAIIEKYPDSPYADQAELTLARIAVDDGRPEAALAPLERVMNDSRDHELRKIARLRLARVEIDEGKPDAALATLAVSDAGSFAPLYDDARGDALYAKKDLHGAAAEYQKALAGSGEHPADEGLIQMKLNDLGGAAPPPATTGAAAPKAGG